MQRPKARAPAASLSRFASLLAQIESEHRLRRSLTQIPSDELDRTLRSIGKRRGELFTVFKGNARHRQRLALMLHHFGVDPDFASHSYWNALRHADHVCVQCPSVRRCRSWISWGASNDAPRVFCPNADLFDEIAGQAPLRRTA